MKAVFKAVALVFPLLLLNFGAARAEPSKFTIVNAAHEAGCTAYSPRIRKISESGEFPRQYVYQVECDPVQGTYVIVVCEGDFECVARF